MAINPNPQIIPAARTTTGGGDDKEYTFVFDDTMREQVFDKIRIWQIFPSVCASMLCIPFGMMLGWPSPTYPTLLQTSSIIPITIDQSAMIAGCLMIGNTISTPFLSTTNQRFLTTKYSIIISVTLMLIGWIVMWQANDIYALISSRLIVGIGNGYGTGQLRHYISEICEANLSPILIKQIPIYVNVGVMLSFAIGPFLVFRKLSIIAIILTVIILFLTIFLPTTPRQLVQNGHINDAKKLLNFLNHRSNVDREIVGIRQRIDHNNDLNWIEVWTNPAIRANLWLLMVLVFFQQFSGMPATLVYTQIFFTATQCPQPEFCAIIYCSIYFVANIFGAFLIPKYNKKSILIVSSVTVSILLSLEIAIVLFEINRFFQYISLVIMGFFNVFHTLGLGNVPTLLIPDLFPQNSSKIVVQFSTMLNSMFALIVTKIFQVLYDQFDIYVPLCLFCCVSLLSIIFIIVFIPKNVKN